MSHLVPIDISTGACIVEFTPIFLQLKGIGGFTFVQSIIIDFQTLARVAIDRFRRIQMIKSAIDRFNNNRD